MQLASRLLLSLCFAKGNAGICFCFFSFHLVYYIARIYSLRRQERELVQTCAFKACHVDLGRDVVRPPKTSQQVLCLQVVPI